MRTKDIDRRVKEALFEGFSQLVEELKPNRCIDKVFPSIKDIDGGFGRENVDKFFKRIVYYAPFNATNRTKINGVEFHLYYDSIDYNERLRPCYVVEIVIPATLETLAVGYEEKSIGSFLLEYVTEHVSHLVGIPEVGYQSVVFEKKAYGYRTFFEVRE